MRLPPRCASYAFCIDARMPATVRAPGSSGEEAGATVDGPVRADLEDQMTHHDVLIVGGGNAGISLAARLLRDGAEDVAVVESETVHRYRPLLNYVGAGEATMASLERPAAEVIPDGCTWINDQVVAVDAAGPSVLTRDGGRIELLHVGALPRASRRTGTPLPAWRRPTRPAGPGRPSSSRPPRACGPRCGSCPRAAWCSPCRPSRLPAARPRSSRSSWRATTGGAPACCTDLDVVLVLPGPRPSACRRPTRCWSGRWRRTACGCCAMPGSPSLSGRRVTVARSRRRPRSWTT